MKPKKAFVIFVCSVYWQVQAMNEVSALSPFPARYTSINFTTSQSGEQGTIGMKKMRWKRGERESMCACVRACACMCVEGFSFSSIFPPPALWTEGCSRLQYPVNFYYCQRGRKTGQITDWKTNERETWTSWMENWTDKVDPLYNFLRNWCRLMRTLRA